MTNQERFVDFVLRFSYPLEDYIRHYHRKAGFIRGLHPRREKATGEAFPSAV